MLPILLELTFAQTLVNTALDKGILAIVLLIVGWWLNQKLESIRSELQKSLERFKTMDALYSKMTRDRIDKTAEVWAACHGWTKIVNDVYYDLVAKGKRDGATDATRRDDFKYYDREPRGRTKGEVDTKGQNFRTLYVTNRVWTTDVIYGRFNAIHSTAYDCLYSLKSGKVADRIDFNENVDPLLAKAADSLGEFFSDPKLWRVPTEPQTIL